MLSATRRPWLVLSLMLLTGCLGSYELSLGSERKPSTPQVQDAGSQGDARARDEDAATRCSSDDDCAGSVRHICDSNAHVCYECNSNSDCQERAGFPHCNLTLRECEGCREDSECPDGTKCQARTCTR